MKLDGRLIHGRMDAANLADLETRLKRLGLDFVNGSEVRRRAFMRAGKVPRRELIDFCFHLEQLTGAGVPILEALADLRDSLFHPHLREVIAGVIESIEGGRTLSQAMSEHPVAFNKVFCSLVRAGEDAGKLPEVLRNLNASLKWEDELASQTRKLFIYPAFVGTVVLGVTIFLMIYLVPQIAGFVKSMGQTLPMQTRILMAASALFARYWYLILGAPVLAALGIGIAVHASPAARLRFDRIKLRLPVLGPILRKLILSRFAGIFAMMYASGIAIIDSIGASEEVVGNMVIHGGLKRARELIIEGHNVTAAFQHSGHFPPLVIRMLRVGENTGALDAALLNVAYFYNRDVKESIEKLQAMIEPAMTLVLGGLLGWVMLSVLGPIYDVITRLRI